MQSEQLPSAGPPHACRAPAGQLSHSVHMVWPAEGWKNSAAHSEQALTAEAAVNFPTAHSVQELAPGSLPVLVIEPAVHVAHTLWPAEGWNNPAAHSEQALITEAAVNFPTAHSVQELAAGSLPVLVIEPAAHTMQEAALGSLKYLPAAHAVQVAAPAAEPVSVIEPA